MSSGRANFSGSEIIPPELFFDGGSGGVGGSSGEGLQAALAADMAGLGDTSMTGMLSNGEIMTSFDSLDVMPMAMDVSIEPSASPSAFTNINSAVNPSYRSSQPTDESAAHLTGAGAGPLPTGFGAQPTVTSGSTVTEFTKRRNWPQKAVDELKDFLLILNQDGRFLFSSPSTQSIVGYEPSELTGKFMNDYLHQDDSGLFVREFNESMATGNPLRFFYRFKKKDGNYMIFEAHGHPHLAPESQPFSSSVQSFSCRGFFLMSRPYPTKNAALLDSFLEHKIENERLTRKIEDLKREEREEADVQQQHWLKHKDGHASVTPSESQVTEAMTPSSTPASGQSNDLLSMPPPAKPGTSNTALTRQALDQANLSSNPDTINDKMARYEGSSHIDTIEMLTGLHYREGERAKGVSTGERSPTLIIRGDVGIEIPVDKTRELGDKKRKTKVADEYVCTDCGTLESPEWRKGPNGPKTLCNACGLRWAKKEKKRSLGPGGSSSLSAAGHSGL